MPCWPPAAADRGDDEAGGETATESSGGSDLSGRIQADGSSTVGPLATAAAERFQQENPDVQVTVGVSGTGGGFERFCRGETDLSNASREIDEEEAAICETAGIEPVEFQVANDALTVVVNTDNDWVTCLTTEQLATIWGPDSNVSSWKDVDPSFPDEKLSLFGPGTDSGTFDYFTDAINGEEGASRSDYSASEDDNTIVTGVSGEKGGLGYFGFSYFEENQDTLKAVEIDSGDGCVAPSVETAQDGTYTPLSRPLFIYAKKEALGRPEVESFVTYLLDNSTEIAEASQFVPLTDEQLTKAKGDLEAALGAWLIGNCRTADDAPDGAGSHPRPCQGNRLAAAAASVPRASSVRARRRRYGEDVVKGVLGVCALISVATTVGIVVALFVPRSSSSRRSRSSTSSRGLSGRRCSSRRTSGSCRWLPARCSSPRSRAWSRCRSDWVPRST